MDKQPISRRRFLALSGAGLAGMAGCAPRVRETAARPLPAPVSPEGTLLLIGGGCQQWTLAELQARSTAMSGDEIDPSGLYREMIALTRKPQPVVEIITSASRLYADETADQYRLIFERLGGKVNTIASRDPEKLAHDPSLQQRLARADLVFITGGDQEELTRLLRKSPIYSQLRKRYEQDPGFVLAGTSAGSMVMSEYMIGGDAPDKRNCPRLVPGFGFMPAIIDTHMDSASRRHRDRRLLHAVCATGEHIGIGLDNATALVVRNGRIEAAGTGSVLLAATANCKLEGGHAQHCQLGDLRDCSDFTPKSLQLYRLKRGQGMELGMLCHMPPEKESLLAGNGTRSR